MWYLALNDSKNRIESSADDDEGQMDINENITTTTNDNNIEEEEGKYYYRENVLNFLFLF